MTRPNVIVTDVIGNEVRLPTTNEIGDWEAVCQTCGHVCGESFGHPPNEDDCKYVACPVCGHSGEPHIVWEAA